MHVQVKEQTDRISDKIERQTNNLKGINTNKTEGNWWKVQLRINKNNNQKLISQK